MERLTTLVVALITLVMIGGCQAPQSRGGRDQDEMASRRAAAAHTNVQLAVGYLEQGRYEVALEKIERAVRIDPSNPQAHTVAGVIYDRLGDMKQAGYHYRQAVKLKEGSGQLTNNYGQFLCKSGDTAEGLQYLDQAVQDPFYETPWVALTNAGDCEERRNDAAAAEQYYRRALELRESYPDALYRMARLMLAQGEAFKARAFMQRFEAERPPTPESLRLGIEVEKALENPEAIKAYEQQLNRLFPDARQSG